ncbi:MAG: putative 7-carboxy-7-deazaguanine synthase QueE [Lachnospiraceae bacterium]|nr:putative 7-carboxy-7-deazaguanine synthase QueE [Lachnospiraceae bacterium]
MGRYKVVEHFLSINGEGKRAGQLAYFIRFAGCNLQCDYCDTKWANEEEVEYSEYDENSLYSMIKGSGVKNVTLTGGEPLIQQNIIDLLDLLGSDKELYIEIETNGSVDIIPFLPQNKVCNLTFTLDYKLGVSGMENRMFLKNFEMVREYDTVKFVVGSKEDLLKSREIINEYKLVEKGCAVILSPCYEKIEPSVIVDFMKEKHLNGVNVQLQMHKYIWSPDQRGV